MIALAKRNIKEILRDPLTVFFGIVFPLVLLVLLRLIGRNAPVEQFQLHMLAPGVAAFGYSFISLFSALLISKDRAGALMLRLLASPLTARDFILGYSLLLLPMAAAQSLLCLLVGVLMGLEPGWRMLLCVAVLLPAAVIYIALGLIFGSLLTDRQVGGICGALLTNFTAWFSGVWFDLELVGGAFAAAARILPFANIVDAARFAISGDYASLLRPMLVVFAYAAVLSIAAVRIFAARMGRT